MKEEIKKTVEVLLEEQPRTAWPAICLADEIIRKYYFPLSKSDDFERVRTLGEMLIMIADAEEKADAK